MARVGIRNSVYPQALSIKQREVNDNKVGKLSKGLVRYHAYVTRRQPNIDHGGSTQTPDFMPGVFRQPNTDQGNASNTHNITVTNNESSLINGGSKDTTWSLPGACGRCHLCGCAVRCRNSRFG